MQNENQNEPFELEEENIILPIPVDTVQLELTARYLDGDGEVRSARATYKRSDIRQMRKDFLENVDDGDEFNVRYTLTDKGREMLNQMDSLHV